MLTSGLLIQKSMYIAYKCRKIRRLDRYRILSISHSRLAILKHQFRMGAKASRVHHTVDSSQPHPESLRTTPHADPPPPYIRASDIPQWHWSNPECVDWLTAMFEGQFCQRPSKARRTALLFKGTGIDLWTNTLIDWVSLLGEYPGHELYLSMRLRYMRGGGVPEGIKIPHFQADKPVTEEISCWRMFLLACVNEL